jgi:hypothetical protein
MNIEMIPFLFVGVGIFTFCLVRYNLTKFLYLSVGVIFIYFSLYGWDGFLNTNQFILGRYGFLQVVIGAIVGAIIGFKHLDDSIKKETE